MKQIIFLPLVLFCLTSCDKTKKYERLRDKLLSGAPHEKARAKREFSELGPRDAGAIPVIVELMKDREYVYHGWKWLSNIGEQACPTVLSLMESSNANQRLGGILAFKGFQDHEEVFKPGAKIIVLLCDDDDPVVRAEALQSLSHIAGFVSDDVIAAHLEKALNDPNRRVVAMALSALGSLGKRMKKLLPLLVQMLDQGNKDVRRLLVDATFYINANDDKDLSRRILDEAKIKGYDEIFMSAKRHGLKTD